MTFDYTFGPGGGELKEGDSIRFWVDGHDVWITMFQGRLVTSIEPHKERKTTPLFDGLRRTQGLEL